MSKLNLVENEEDRNEISMSWNKVAYSKNGYDVEKMHNKMGMNGNNVHMKTERRFKFWQLLVIFAFVLALFSIFFVLGFAYITNKSNELHKREIGVQISHIQESITLYNAHMGAALEHLVHQMDQQKEHMHEQIALQNQHFAMQFGHLLFAHEQREEANLKEKTKLQQIRLEHRMEHENAKIELVNITHNEWNTNTSSCPQCNVTGTTVNAEYNALSQMRTIRTLHGFPTNFSANPDGRLGFKISYAEFAIESDSLKAGSDFEQFQIKHGTKYGHVSNVQIFLASEDFIKNGTNCNNYNVSGSFFYGIRNDGQICKSQGKGMQKLDSSSDFAFGDIIGCGLLVTLKSATAKAANCTPCQQPTSWLFFTKNGEIFDTPQPLPTNVPSQLFPTVAFFTFYYDGKVTANFGQKPFMYDIRAAKDLCVGAYCHSIASIL